MTNYLASNGGIANTKALYEISSGGNDITFAGNNLVGPGQTTYLTQQALAPGGGLLGWWRRKRKAVASA